MASAILVCLRAGTTKKIDATLLVGCWAVHENLDRLSHNLYSMTHVPTGVCVAVGTKRACMKYARDLPQVGLDLEPGDIDGLSRHTDVLGKLIDNKHKAT